MKYEVYILLNPNQQGKYVFEQTNLKYRPFYIGKGSILGQRKYKKKNKVVEGYINNLKQQGIVPIYHTYIETDDEQYAFQLEMNLIKHFKRKPHGLLLNLSDGGEGPCGYKCNKQQLLIRSKNMKRYFDNLTPEQKKLHGLKSLKNRNPVNVRLGALKCSITKRSWDKNKKQQVENLRKPKWIVARNNRTLEQKQLTSKKCTEAGKLQSRVYFTLFLIKENIELTKTRLEWKNYGIPHDQIYVLRNNNDTKTIITTKTGIPYRYIRSFLQRQ